MWSARGVGFTLFLLVSHSLALQEFLRIDAEPSNLKAVGKQLELTGNNPFEKANGMGEEKAGNGGSYGKDEQKKAEAEQRKAEADAGGSASSVDPAKAGNPFDNGFTDGFKACAQQVKASASNALLKPTATAPTISLAAPANAASQWVLVPTSQLAALVLQANPANMSGPEAQNIQQPQQMFQQPLQLLQNAPTMFMQPTHGFPAKAAKFLTNIKGYLAEGKETLDAVREVLNTPSIPQKAYQFAQPFQFAQAYQFAPPAVQGMHSLIQSEIPEINVAGTVTSTRAK